MNTNVGVYNNKKFGLFIIHSVYVYTYIQISFINVRGL